MFKIHEVERSTVWGKRSKDRIRKIIGTVVYSLLIRVELCEINERIKSFILQDMLYFRIQRALSGGAGKLLEDLNTTYGSGVLTCDYEGQEFKAFLKWLMKNYFR